MEAQVASIKDSEGRAFGPYALHSQTESKCDNEVKLISARPGNLTAFALVLWVDLQVKVREYGLGHSVSAKFGMELRL